MVFWRELKSQKICVLGSCRQAGKTQKRSALGFDGCLDSYRNNPTFGPDLKRLSVNRPTKSIVKQIKFYRLFQTILKVRRKLLSRAFFFSETHVPKAEGALEHVG